MSGKLENSQREYDLEKQLHLLRQERELTIMELAEFKDREAQLKRLNQTLMKALTQEKPSNALLHEIKLIIEQCGGSEREKQLEGELDRMRKEKDREVEDRVQAIVKEGKLGKPQGKCKKCEEYLDRIARLEAEVKRVNIIIVTLTDENTHLNEELCRATSDISNLENAKTDLELDLKRVRDTYESQLTKLKEFKRKEQTFQQSEAASRLEAEWRDKLEKAEVSNRQQMQRIGRQLEEGYQAFIDKKINEVANQYEEQLQQRINEMEQLHRREVERLTMQLSNASRRNEFEEGAKRISRVTPTKSRGPIENNGVIGNSRFGQEDNENGQDFKLMRQAKSRTIYQDDNRQGHIKQEIQNIISGLARTKQNTSQLGGVNVSTLSGYPGGPMSEYSNFSIKDSLNRPNTILESHLRLKRRE